MRGVKTWIARALALPVLLLGLGGGSALAVIQLTLPDPDPPKADDITPPPWRGTAGSTFQQWDFPPAAPTTPTAVANPYGAPTLNAAGNVTFGVTAGGLADVVQLAAPAGPASPAPTGTGRLLIDVPNTSSPDMSKEVWLQVTYLGALPPPGVPAPVPKIRMVGEEGESFTQTSTVAQALPNGYIHLLTTWTSPVCPLSEFITIRPATDPNRPQTIFIDQVTIDTRCVAVPEPSALVLLGTGASVLFGLAWRRRASVTP